MALAKVTQDHEEIQEWAEARGAKPAVVSSTEGSNATGILRLMFPDAPNANDGALEEIDWDEWFEKFDSSGLEFHYQDKTADGQQSNFNKLTYPETDTHGGKKPAGKSSTKTSAGKSTAKKATSKAPAKKTAGSSGGVKKSAARKSVAKKAAKKK